MIARACAAFLLLALAAGPAAAARSRYNYACVKRCMDKLPDGGWEPVCVLDRPGKEATMIPNKCALKCGTSYKRNVRWYDRLPVDCTSRVGCSLMYQGDARCKAAWEAAVGGDKAARPEANPDCSCSAELPRNKRWFGGSFEPACGRPQPNTVYAGPATSEWPEYAEEVAGVASMDACCAACKNVAACTHYSWDKKSGACWLKSPAFPKTRARRGVQSARLVDPDAKKKPGHRGHL